MKNKYTYSILSPSGNDTALVSVDKKPEVLLKQKVNSIILSENSNVEQVGFIWQEKSQYFLEMAGGEFCGNATRCATWSFLQQKTGKIKISVSGTSKTLEAGVTDDSSCWTEIPLTRIMVVNNFPVIELEGIVHVLVSIPQTMDPENLKPQARDIIQNLQLLQTFPAAGVMFYTDENTAVSLQPIVMVRDIDTLFYESACGSGTAALGYYLSKTQDRSTVTVLQPSGKTISVTYSNEVLTISGKIKALAQKTLYL